MKNKITAIIVNYKCFNSTKSSVESILNSKKDVQVIVVDNSECIEEHEKLIFSLPSTVKTIKSDDNIGFGNACNLGFQQSNNELILLLNPDALILGDTLDDLVEFMINNPDVAAVSPRVWWDVQQKWFLPPSLLPTPFTEFCRLAAMRWHLFGKVLSWNFRHQALRFIQSTVPLRQKMLSGGNILLRRTAIEKAGGFFDPKFFMYYEDTDLCLRLRRAGYKLCLLPKAHAIHQWCSKKNEYVLSASSRKYYFEKHFQNSIWQKCANMLARNLTSRDLSPDIDLGVLREPFHIEVSPFSSDRWQLELSPSPLFIPSIYHFGEGVSFCLSEELWQRLDLGRYYIRILRKGCKKAMTYTWEIDREK